MPESSVRVAPYLNPQHFSFYGLKFGDRPKAGMYSVTPDDVLPRTAVYRMTNDPIEKTFLTLYHPTLKYEYYNNRLFRIVASLKNESCSSFYGLAYSLNTYKNQLKSLYRSLKTYELRGLRETESIEGAEARALKYINELEESDIKWGYLFEPATLKQDTHDILHDELLKGDVANSMMPGFILSGYKVFIAHYRFTQGTKDYKRLQASTNDYVAPYYLNKSTRVEFTCGDQQLVTFSDLKVAEKHSALLRDVEFGQWHGREKSYPVPHRKGEDQVLFFLKRTKQDLPPQSLE